jgi:hypothetical protein
LAISTRRRSYCATNATEGFARLGQGNVSIPVPEEDNARADTLSDVVRPFRERLEQANSPRRSGGNPSRSGTAIGTA